MAVLLRSNTRVARAVEQRASGVTRRVIACEAKQSRQGAWQLCSLDASSPLRDPRSG